MIQYRRLEKHELTPELFQDFIRHQTVQDCYRKREGRWVIEPAPFIDDWSREEYDFLVQCLKDTIDGNGAVYGAFQAEALGHDFLGGFHPDIAVVPGLIPYAGQALLVPWVAEDKAIFLAVGHQPLLLGGVFLLFLQNLVIRRHNVGR